MVFVIFVVKFFFIFIEDAMRKQPTTALPLTLGQVARGLWGAFDNRSIERFERRFAQYIGTGHAVAAGSGTAAFYLLLTAMARLRPGRDEVILPAYSVPTLIHAVRLAGIRPVYCDVETDTFNMDPVSMEAMVTGRTLAIVPFHNFGFPGTLDRAMEIGRERGIYVIEDACQALGAKLRGKRAGTLGNAGFFSLCKGKIISTFRGGIAVTGDERLAGELRVLEPELPPQGAVFRYIQPPLMAALSLAMRPWFYGTFFPLVSRFKSTTVHESFQPARFTSYGAELGTVLLGELDRWTTARQGIGHALMNGLRGEEGIILPRIIEGAEPSFNHVPVVFHDIRRLEETQRRLWTRGIDTARMYERPVHRIYPDLGYPESPEPFPGATYIAPRLLTLPSHPYLTPSDVDIIIETVRGTG